MAEPARQRRADAVVTADDAAQQRFSHSSSVPIQRSSPFPSTFAGGRASSAAAATRLTSSPVISINVSSAGGWSGRGQPCGIRSTDTRSSRAARPPTVRFDPFPAGRRRVRKRKVNERDRRLLAAAVAQRHDLAAVGDIQLPDRDRHSKDERVERQGEFLLERRVKSDSLFGNSISVDDRLFNQFVEKVRRQPAALPRL